MVGLGNGFEPPKSGFGGPLGGGDGWGKCQSVDPWPWLSAGRVTKFRIARKWLRWKLPSVTSDRGASYLLIAFD